MKLEMQIEKLAEIGLHLAEGITADDIVFSFPREEFEAKPFDLLLFSYGIEVEREPWGRPISTQVWNFDTECIVGTGSYVAIMEELRRITGQPERLTELNDFVHMDDRDAWLEYCIDGRRQRWDVDVIDDWADTLALSYVMDDIERDGFRFYFRDNGQAMILFYLDLPSVTALRALCPLPIEPVVKTNDEI
jgi:hypothetical protein